MTSSLFCMTFTVSWIFSTSLSSQAWIYIRKIPPSQREHSLKLENKQGPFFVAFCSFTNITECRCFSSWTLSLGSDRVLGISFLQQPFLQGVQREHNGRKHLKYKWLQHYHFISLISLEHGREFTHHSSFTNNHCTYRRRSALQIGSNFRSVLWLSFIEESCLLKIRQT